MKIAKISLHDDKTSQYWYGTTKDSQIMFSDGFKNLAKNSVFDIGRNGGSYSLNFNKADISTVIKICKENGYKVRYIKKIGKEIDISKKEYMKSNIVDILEKETILICNTMTRLGM